MGASLYMYLCNMLNILAYQYPPKYLQKLKKQIWKNNFIDLGVLLPQMASQERQSFLLEIGTNSDFNLLPKSKLKKILSKDTWTSVFHRFIAIYREKFPLEIQPLLKYCKIIRDLAQRKNGVSWSVYDQ